jgi:hypothetical protein
LLAAFRGGTRPWGDPAKAAQVILGLADMPAPPLRLPLGSDAVIAIRAADEQKLADLARWEALSTTTDADPAPVTPSVTPVPGLDVCAYVSGSGGNV